MNVFLKALPVGLLLLSSACDGSQEQAGEQADAAAGVVGSEDSVESGPAENLGEQIDEARESAAEAIDARADALEARADSQIDAAEQRAEALKQQAEELRSRESGQ